METIFKTYQIHARKPKIETPLGIKYVVVNGILFITGIADDSIFKEEGELRIGHEVVEVNGTSLADQARESAGTLLASLGENIVFVVKSTWIAKMELKKIGDDEESHVDQGTSEAMSEAAHNNRSQVIFVNFTKKKLPRFLEGRNVPMSIWRAFCTAIDSKLFPAMSDSYRMEELWRQEMDTYTKKQASKELELFVNSGPKHQKKVFRMTQTIAAIANGTSLIANNILSWMNVLLQPYGLYCQLDLKSYELPKYSDTKQDGAFVSVRIVGIEFVPTDLMSRNMDDGFSGSTLQTEDGSAVSEDGPAVSEIDTTRWC